MTLQWRCYDLADTETTFKDAWKALDTGLGGLAGHEEFEH